jgi:hypothetical protein
MRSSFTFCALLLVLFLPACVLGQVGAIDFTTGKENSHTHSGSTDLRPLTGDTRQGAVLWDTTHGVYNVYKPSGSYSNLCQMLVDSGFTVDVCGTGVHTVNLSLYDIVVVPVTSNWYSVYTQEEVDTLVSFYNAGHQRIILTGDCNFCDNAYMPNVDNNQFSYNIFEWLSQGGGILIMGENTGCPNANVQPVSQAFNLDNGVGDMGTETFSNFAAHPVFNNVSAIYYIAPGEISASAPAQVIAWTDGTNIPTVAARDEAIGIELNAFIAHLEKKGVMLQWETSCEMNNAAWRVDRKSSRDTWNTLTIVPSAGNSPDGNTYSYIDVEADPRVIQVYRLGSIDRYGGLSWNATVKVDPHLLGIQDAQGIMRISPNPFVTHTDIKIYLPGNQRFLKIYDVLGSVVKNFRLPTSYSIFPTVVSWDGTDDSGVPVRSGIYFCQFYTGSKGTVPHKVILLK